MTNPNLYVLVEKYLKNKITNDEAQILEDLLKNEENARIFKTMVQEDSIIKTKDKVIDTEKAFAEIAPKLEEETLKGVFKLKKFYRYAAVAVIVLGLGYSFSFLKRNTANTKPINKFASQEIRLILDDGTEHILTNTSYDSIKANNNSVLGLVQSGKLRYIENDLIASTTYNTLQIPFGQKFQVVLSDGSKVHLNAGSSLRYPVSFATADQREVHLTGEAFFEVSKNPSKKFIVSTKEQTVEVLGTEFNVSAYENDDFVTTTLREGSVKVNNTKDALVLVPNEQSALHKGSEVFEKQIVDVSQFTGWMEGNSIFTDMRFNNIIKQLERTYDVQIVNKNTELGKQHFTARFKNESIQQIMNYFKQSYEFKFTANERTLTIE